MKITKTCCITNVHNLAVSDMTKDGTLEYVADIYILTNL